MKPLKLIMYLAILIALTISCNESTNPCSDCETALEQLKIDYDSILNIECDTTIIDTTIIINPPPPPPQNYTDVFVYNNVRPCCL